MIVRPAAEVIDQHEIYMALFEAALAAGAPLEDYCLVGYTIPTSRSRLVRFGWIVRRMYSIIRWCDRYRFIGKAFILREFSTWGLILLLPLVWRARGFVGYNVNHNLASPVSRAIVTCLSRWVPIYYFSGTAQGSQLLPAQVRVLPISAAYRAARQPRSGPCVVILPRRADQFEVVPRSALREALAVAPSVQWIGAAPDEPLLSRTAYRELIAGARCIVLAYHQGEDTIRHSGVIWDALLAGTPILCADTPSFVDQAGPARGTILQTYSTAPELRGKLEAMLI
jgi:hypothetical protein